MLRRPRGGASGQVHEAGSAAWQMGQIPRVHPPPGSIGWKALPRCASAPERARWRPVPGQWGWGCVALQYRVGMLRTRAISSRACLRSGHVPAGSRVAALAGAVRISRTEGVVAIAYRRYWPHVIAARSAGVAVLSFRHFCLALAAALMIRWISCTAALNAESVILFQVRERLRREGVAVLGSSHRVPQSRGLQSVGKPFCQCSHRRRPSIRSSD